MVRPHLFPRFRVVLSDGLEFTDSLGTLGFQAGYGQTAAYTLSVQGADAKAMMDKGILERGLRLSEVYAGYSDEMPLVARNLRVWEDSFSNDSEAGKVLGLTAYGCSQLLRQSGQRTVKLTSTTYAGAAREVAARHGLSVRVGSSANREVLQEQAQGEQVLAETPPPISVPNSQVLTMGLRVARGEDIGLSNDAKFTPYLCARFVREVVEKAFGIGAFQWALSRAAAVNRRERGGSADFAVDYEEGAREIGLAVSGPPQPGDIVFQSGVSLPWGHIAIFVGDVDGVPSVIENTIKQGGKAVYGRGPVRLTPLSEFGTITTVARPKIANALEGLDTEGVTASVPSAQAAAPRQITQANQTDWDFLSELGKQIGYILAETDLGDGLYFGPGLEVGSRTRHLLIQGAYSLQGQRIPANVVSFNGGRSLFGLPSEMILTGYEKGQAFSLIVTPDELADRHRLAADGQQTVVTGNALEGLDTDGVTATPLVGRDPATGQFTQTRLSAGDFAGKLVRDLTKGLYPDGSRRVLDGNTSQAQARARGLEAMALEQLKFQEVEIDVFGLPKVRPGHEVELRGDEVPKPYQGIYLVRDVSGSLEPDGGYAMKLTLNRNTV